MRDGRGDLSRRGPISFTGGEARGAIHVGTPAGHSEDVFGEAARMDHLPAQLLDRQAGVVGRQQLLDLGAEPWDIERWVRRRELARALPGVFVAHTGPLSWLQRAWVGLVHLSPSVLAGDAALRAAVGPDWRRARDADPIALAVVRDRHVAAPPGYRLVRPIHLARSGLWQLSPPRLRPEDAALDLAAAAGSDTEAFSVLAEAVRLGVTTPKRLSAAMAVRRRVRRRAVLREVLADLAAGTESVLEREYHRMAAAHGLPRGVRQHIVLVGGRRRRRDVAILAHQVVVELDGRHGHDSAEGRACDLQRDLDAAEAGELTVRLGWAQVTQRPCETARQLAVILRARGWAGSLRPCGPDCGAPRAA
jgi:very-short-patch-repair endonuclease